MDHQIFSAINGLAGKWPWLDITARFFGGDDFLCLFIFLVAVLWLWKKYRINIYLALGSVFVARGIVTEILKRIINRPRPYEVLQVHKLIIDFERGVSFPSGHATVYFALAFSFWGTKYFWPFFVLALLGSAARVFVGVHYPLDILAGAIIGLATALILRRLFKKRILS